MKSKKALKEFEMHLRRAGEIQVSRVPCSGIQSMLAFYREVRADDVNVESDGDMLLFQWGTYDWGRGAMFEVDITRQLICGTGEDNDIWQLDLRYRFPPSEVLRAIGRGDRWCALPADLAVFERFVMTHPAVVAVGSRTDGETSLEYECT